MASIRRRRQAVGGGIATGSSSPTPWVPANQQPAERRRGRRSTAPSPAAPPPLTTTIADIKSDNNVGRLVASRRRTSTIGQVRSGGIEFPTPPTQTQQTTIQRTRRSPPRPPINEPTKNQDNSNIASTGGVINTATRRGKATRYKRVKNCKCSSCMLRNSGDDGIKKWEDSDAKAHLKDNLLSDKTHRYWNDPPSKVYDDNKRLFHQYKYERFSANLRSLKNGISSEQENVDFDEAALDRESIAFPRGQITNHGNPFYDTSETKKLLVGLAKEGKLEQYKHHPSILMETNPIFHEYSGKVFAKAVNREKRRVKETVGWQMKRNIQGSKKHNAKYDKVQTAGE